MATHFAWASIFGFTAVLGGCTALVTDGSEVEEQSATEQNGVPDGKGIGTRLAPYSGRELHLPRFGSDAGKDSGGSDAGKDSAVPTTPPPPSTNGITYHGGGIFTSAPNVYFVWYGNWKGSPVPAILADWAKGIGGSSYFAINSTYTDALGNPVPNAVKFAGQSSDDYSQGDTLTDTQVGEIAVNAIKNSALPKDPNGVYFVVASADVTEVSGFCTAYCGWHSSGVYASTPIHYGFIGDPDRCPNACEAQTTSPNGSAAADGMASVLSHELSETMTDPNGNGWFDKAGNENADKCAWNFGVPTVVKGVKFNTTFGGRNWLLQQNWVNAKGGYCAMHL